MSVKAKVLKCEFAKEFTTKDGGIMYSWNVVTDTGDAGTTNTQKHEAPWNTGDEAEYDLVKKDYNGTTYTTLKKVYANSGGGFGGGARKAWTPDPERETRSERIARQLLIVRQSTMTNAMEFVCRTTKAEPSIDAVFAVQVAMEKHVLRGDILKRMATHGEHAAPAPSAPATALDAAAQTAKSKAATQEEPMAKSPLGEDDLPF
jgi:hypothetical protein